jgi:predicted nucleic-acid-binding protein
VIGLDTNILVRHLTNDEPEQSARVARLIASLSAEEPGFIPLVSLAELIWVLQVHYAVTKDEMIVLVEDLLHTEQFIVEDAEVVAHAVRAYAASNADFADCLIERSGHHAKCTHTVTLDIKAAKTARMMLLDS